MLRFDDREDSLDGFLKPCRHVAFDDLGRARLVFRITPEYGDWYRAGNVAPQAAQQIARPGKISRVQVAKADDLDPCGIELTDIRADVSLLEASRAPIPYCSSK